MSTLVMLGKARTRVLSKLCGRTCPLAAGSAGSGARKALMKVTGTSAASCATGYMTKKLTCIEPQSTLRRLVIFASLDWPAMSKRKLSPSLRPRVLARPSSTLMAPCSPASQRPATTSLWTGLSVLLDRLNSRSNRRLARSSSKFSGVTSLPLIATSRPRIIGYQSNLVTPPSFSACRKASPCSGCTLMTKRLGASGGVAWRQLLIRSVRSSTSSISASRPMARALVCTTA